MQRAGLLPECQLDSWNTRSGCHPALFRITIKFYTELHTEGDPSTIKVMCYWSSWVCLLVTYSLNFVTRDSHLHFVVNLDPLFLALCCVVFTVRGGIMQTVLMIHNLFAENEHILRVVMCSTLRELI